MVYFYILLVHFVFYSDVLYVKMHDALPFSEYVG